MESPLLKHELARKARKRPIYLLCVATECVVMCWDLPCAIGETERNESKMDRFVAARAIA
jgi:hypothetical protein